MKLVSRVFTATALGLPVLLAGCSGGGQQDLIQYMQEVRQRPSKPIEPIPPFAEYHSFAYSSAGKRSPFDQPIEIMAIATVDMSNRPPVKPDPNRPKEFLENFSISAIAMVGTMAKNNQLWALVNDGTGNIHRVKVGNYMGRNQGRISNVTNTQIELVEIVPDGGGGWFERPQVVKLVESKN